VSSSPSDLELDEPVRQDRRFRTRFGRPRSFRTVLREGAPTPVVARRERIGRVSLAIADAVAAALVLGGVIQWSGGSPLWAFPLAIPVILVANKVAGLYDRDDLLLNKTTLDEAPQLLQICGLFALVVWLLYEPVTPYVLGSWQVLCLWFGSVALIIGGRMLARRAARHIGGVQRCLVVGDPHAVGTLARKLRESDADAEVAAVLPVPAGGLPDDLTAAVRAAVRRDRIDRVIVAPRSTDAAEMLEVIRVAKLEGVRVTVLPRLFEVVGSSVEFDQVDGLTMLGVRRFGLTRSSRLIKRAFDVAGTTVLLLAAAPVMAVIALAIRLDSSGPILFRQLRVGRDGTYFHMLKFRSMVADADVRKADLLHLNETEGLFKIAEDPRITRVGRSLRRASLDELPQLFNVWRGEMSLVGPRPLVLDEDALVRGLDRARLHLTPGMTGPWQVLGSTRVPMSEMVVIDYLYAANWSLWSDMKILLRTIPHMVSGRGR
jgi:exopolysaccharide biosynthesis polyprenyl glycosylphosphotransferase